MIRVLWHTGLRTDAETAEEIIALVWENDGRPGRSPQQYMRSVARKAAVKHQRLIEEEDPETFIADMAMVQLCRILQWPELVAIDPE